MVCRKLALKQRNDSELRKVPKVVLLPKHEEFRSSGTICSAKRSRVRACRVIYLSQTILSCAAGNGILLEHMFALLRDRPRFGCLFVYTCKSKMI